MNNNSNLLYYSTCFITGFAILVFELLSFRMLAPYFGNSSIVIGTIINSILLALAIGYVLGGYIADKKKSSTLIYHVILASSIYIFLMYLTYPVLLQSLADLPVIPGSLISIIILFFLPMVLLSFVPPYLIKIISHQDDVGISSGKIFSLSTIGSIIGGTVTTFVLIPYIGTKTSILLSTLTLFALAIVGLRNTKLIALALIFIALSPFRLSARHEPNIIYQGESLYNIITVTEAENLPYKARYLKLNENIGHHSVSIDPATCLSNTYADMHLFPHIISEAEKTLILGNGAGTMMTQLSCLFDTAVDGVEIDPKLTEIGLHYFGLTLSDKAKVFHEDARVFLAKHKEQYDIIHVDLYSGSPYIPFHLATKEFFMLIYNAMPTDGVMVVNYPKFLAGNNKLSEYYIGTITSVFPATFSTDEALYAFKQTTSVQVIRRKVFRQDPKGSLFIIARDALAGLKAVTPTDSLLTDDFAPLDMLTYNALKR